MNVFETLIVQPIFNLLAFIYGVIPGGDFGISVIILTIIVRILMWPLVKKQLHQTKMMQALQPELKKIKQKAAGDRQLEAQMMMELYRERGVNMFGSIGLLLLQLPIFIALFQVINIITTDRDRIAELTYGPVQQLQPIADIINSSTHQFNESLLNIVNLSKVAISQEGVYIPLVILSVIAALLQFVQSRQITPQPQSNKRLRDMFKDAANNKDVDNSEVSALLTNRMIYVFPLITLMIGLYLPGALVLYFAASSAVAILQQRSVLNKDVQEMEVIAESKTARGASNETTVRVIKAEEAEVVTPKKSSPKKSSSKKKRRRR